MANATTKVSDLIVPEIFEPYVVEARTKRLALLAAGVMRDVEHEVLNQLGGSVINMPFWKPLAATGAVWTDASDIEAQKHTAALASAPVLQRVEAWERSDLSAIMVASDPLTALAEQVADVENENIQLSLIGALNGSVAREADLTLDITSLSGAAAVIDADSFIDAEQKLGDAKGKLIAVAMHSATETKLRKQNLIEYIQPSQGGLPIPFYNGKRVIVDDACPVSSTTYTTYLFAAGSVGFTRAPLKDGQPATEYARDAKKSGGIDTLIRRMRYVVHPSGFAWTPGSGVPAAGAHGPTNAELAGANWDLVHDVKNCGIVAFKHKIA